MIRRSSVDMVRLATPTRLLNAEGALLNEAEAGSNGEIHREYGRIHHLRHFPPRCWTAAGLVAIITRGPVMMEALWDPVSYRAGSGSSGHYVVIVGARGTHTDGRSTTLRIYDPLPDGGIYSATYSAMLRRVPLATYGLYQA
jgi:hypothetical protein